MAATTCSHRKIRLPQSVRMDRHIIAAYRRQTASRPRDIRIIQVGWMVSVCGRLAKRVLQPAQRFGKVASMRDAVERTRSSSAPARLKYRQPARNGCAYGPIFGSFPPRDAPAPMKYRWRRHAPRTATIQTFSMLGLRSERDYPLRRKFEIRREFSDQLNQIVVRGCGGRMLGLLIRLRRLTGRFVARYFNA